MTPIRACAAILLTTAAVAGCSGDNTVPTPTPAAAITRNPAGVAKSLGCKPTLVVDAFAFKGRSRAQAVEALRRSQAKADPEAVWLVRPHPMTNANSDIWLLFRGQQGVATISVTRQRPRRGPYLAAMDRLCPINGLTIPSS